jgi:hypothetical protein
MGARGARVAAKAAETGLRNSRESEAFYRRPACRSRTPSASAGRSGLDLRGRLGCRRPAAARARRAADGLWRWWQRAPGGEPSVSRFAILTRKNDYSGPGPRLACSERCAKDRAGAPRESFNMAKRRPRKAQAPDLEGLDALQRLARSAGLPSDFVSTLAQASGRPPQSNAVSQVQRTGFRVRGMEQLRQRDALRTKQGDDFEAALPGAAFEAGLRFGPKRGFSRLRSGGEGP